MKERYLGFLFFAVLAGFAINLCVDWVHGRFFSASLWFQAHWIMFFVALPAALLLAMAWGMGFFRKGRPRSADAAVILTIALIVYLNLGAGYSCWHYCF